MYRPLRRIIPDLFYQRPVEVLEKQFSLVELNKICTSPDKDSERPNTIYSSLGPQVHTVSLDKIETGHDGNVRWYDEELS